MKLKIFLPFIFICNIIHAQFQDDFSDGNLNQNPSWTGNITDWIVNDGQLQLQASSAGVSYLVTPSVALEEATWEFWLKLDFNPSASNFVKIYLTSDHPNLDQPLNGYFVQIGDTEDEISLYLQQGNQTTKIIDGADDRVDQDPVIVKVRVRRDKEGNWELLSELGATGNFTSEGTAFDNQITESKYFGLLANYTSTRADKIIFDDIKVTWQSEKDTNPPVLNNVTFASPESLTLHFSKGLDPSTAEVSGNYTIDGIGNPQSAQIDPDNPANVLLHLANSFMDAKYYTLHVKNVSDLDGNKMEPVSLEIFYYQEKNVLPLQIVINELLPDPSPSIGLPEEEYIELYNNSDLAFNLQDWVISDNSTQGKLDSMIIFPNQYLILTPNGKKEIFEVFGNVLEIANWPSLNNGGDVIYLKDNANQVIDSVAYDSDTYQDDEKNSGGWSLERIFPSLTCSSVNNWLVSNHISGGTPGQVNSVYSEKPDNQAPTIVSVRVLAENQLEVIFSETMDQASLLGAFYHLQPENLVQNISVSEDLVSIIITFEQPLQAGASYRLTIENASDCIGNKLEVNAVQVVYDNSPPQLLEIIFTSTKAINLLFSEAIDPESALQKNNYLLNNSRVPFAISQPIPEEISLVFSESLVSPGEQLLTLKNIADLQGNIISPTESKFNYQDQLDTIIVVADNHLVVYLNEQPSITSVENTYNFLLNQSVSPVSAFIDEENLKAIHLIFAQNFEHEVWYQLYIKDIFNSTGKRISTPASPFYFDNEAPEIKELRVVNGNTVKVHFSEKVDPVTAGVLINYEINKSIGFPNSLQAEGDSAVILIFESTFLIQERYQLEVNHVNDIYGNTAIRERQYFTFDPAAPQVVFWQLIHPGHLIITFSENLDPASIRNDHFKLNGISLSDTPIELDSYDQNKISVRFPSLDNDVDHLLEMSSIADRNGNIADMLLLNFSTIAPLLSSINPLADSILQLGFSEPIDENEALQPVNYLLNNLHQPVKIHHKGHLVQLIFDQHFSKEDSQMLLVQRIKDITGNAIIDNEQKFLYDDYLESLRIENENTIQLTFELPIEVSTVSENNFFLNNLGNPFLLLPDIKDENILRLIFNKKLAEGMAYQLEIESFSAASSQIIPASVHPFIYDNSPPEIIDLTVEIPRQLKIIFSESLGASSEDERFFQISGVGQPGKVILADSMVTLSFDFDLIDQQTYTLLISGVTDRFGNQLVNYSFEFQYNNPRQAQFNDIIITEIMANPSSSNKLPEVEYIEIFNRSDHDLPVHNFVLQDNTSEGKLTEAILQAGSYAILCTPNAKEQMEKFGQVISVTNMPGLNNTGESLILAYDNGGILFSIAYEESWYKDLLKSEGGWALEMIDTQNPCAGINNWSASEDKSGGTPGSTNSIAQANPDNLGPKLLQATAIDEKTILLTMNEKIDYEMLHRLKLEVRPSIAIGNIQIEPSMNRLKIDLEQPLLIDQAYQLTITEAWDCVGNAIQDNENSAIIMLPEQAEAADLVINEVLFNPRPGGVEFIEIYNTTAKNILMENISIATSTDIEILDIDYLNLPAFEFLVFTKDPSLLKAQHPDAPDNKIITVANLPVLNNEESSLVLRLENEIIDSVYYHSTFHFPLLKEDKGVSLERIYTDQPALDENNWQSAVAQVGFATPGTLNSQARPEVALTGTLSPDPPAFAPGDPGGRSFTSIHYQMDVPGKVATITIHDLNGKIVRTIAQNETLAVSGSFIWDGTSDGGLPVRLGVYLIVMEVYSMAGDWEIYKERIAVARNF